MEEVVKTMRAEGQLMEELEAEWNQLQTEHDSARQMSVCCLVANFAHLKRLYCNVMI